MKKIYLSRVNADLKTLCKRPALEKDANTVIDEECQIFDKDTGEFIIGVFNIKRDTQELKEALESIKFISGKRTSGLQSTSRIFGYSPRVAIRNDFCSSTSLSREYPDEHSVVCGYSSVLDDLYKEYGKNRYGSHKEKTDKVLQDYKIGESVFTSGIINKNNQLNYHYDAGNFTDCFSCMITLKGGISGGRLSMPEYDIKIDLPDSSVAMFDGQSILHGVTPIIRKNNDSYRYTLVYYSLKGMWNCLEPDEELLRIKKKKTDLYRKRYNKTKGDK